MEPPDWLREGKHYSLGSGLFFRSEDGIYPYRLKSTPLTYNFHLTPLRQERANMPVKPFFLIYHQFLEVVGENDTSLNSYFFLFFNVSSRKNTKKN